MKKILFFLLLVILIFINFFKDNKVINKQIVKDNISINYPYFSFYNINNYITSYINKNINESKDNSLIIDYDYNNINNTITFYKTESKNNIINTKINTFKIGNNTFTKINNTKIVGDYSFYYNKFTSENSPIIALTFDDGPNYNTSLVIDILNKYDVTATFFLVGKNIKGNEKVIKKMQESNMEIGNHTFNHLLLSKYSDEKIQEEINTTNELIYEITGKYPLLFRPSYGTVSKKIKKNSNMPIIIWNIDTLDWKYKNSNKIASKILDKVKDGDIILMHDIYKSSLNSLDIFIPKLLERGYRIVSVSELFYYRDILLEDGKVYGFAK